MNFVQQYGGQYEDDGIPHSNIHSLAREWRVDNKLHRIGAPARIYDSGTEHWFINGYLHREDGPAVIHTDCLRYYAHNKYHRTDGPAIVYYANRNPEEWWINNKYINDAVPAWMDEYDINPNWQEWTNIEKILFKLRFA